jgi:MoxR-like ATPase
VVDKRKQVLITTKAKTPSKEGVSMNRGKSNLPEALKDRWERQIRASVLSLDQKLQGNVKSSKCLLPSFISKANSAWSSAPFYYSLSSN